MATEKQPKEKSKVLSFQDNDGQLCKLIYRDALRQGHENMSIVMRKIIRAHYRERGLLNKREDLDQK